MRAVRDKTAKAQRAAFDQRACGNQIIPVPFSRDAKTCFLHESWREGEADGICVKSGENDLSAACDPSDKVTKHSSGPRRIVDRFIVATRIILWSDHIIPNSACAACRVNFPNRGRRRTSGKCETCKVNDQERHDQQSNQEPLCPAPPSRDVQSQPKQAKHPQRQNLHQLS